MGVDFLDLTFRCEREFKIKLARDELTDLLERGKRSNPPPGKWTDLQVKDFVALVEKEVKSQNPTYHGDVFRNVKKQIAECLYLSEEEVTLDSWFGRDLGMD